MEKLRLNTLSIEVTRRCNMSCGHCMRGDAQDLDISHKDIRNVLKNIRYVNLFIITGGEPSLNVRAIRYILKQVKRLGIEVCRFYIVTNGSESSLSAGFINTCCSLYDCQQEKDMRGSFRMLEMSDDRYHDNRLHKKVIGKLERYPFFGLRGEAGVIFLYREGRSQSGIVNHIRELYISDGNYLKEEVYLNAGGMVLSNGDLSYHRQAENELCHSGHFWSYVKHHVEKY